MNPNRAKTDLPSGLFGGKILTETQTKKIYIVGLSGGPDSVALLHMLHKQVEQDSSIRLYVTHCNFHLRGEESMRDQHFCEELCQKWGLTLELADFDTHRYMQEHHLSLELAARKLRYNWWDSLAKRLQEENPEAEISIAVAHHLDDSIETTLMNLMRGTGIKGLTGIPALRGKIIRPLLHSTRAEILSYNKEHNLEYVTDSTNMENDVTRNKIRNLLIPLMEEINPNARHGIALSMNHLALSDQLADERMDEILNTVHLHRQAAGIEWEEWLLSEEWADSKWLDTLSHHLQRHYSKIISHNRLLYTEPDMSQLKQEAETRCTLMPKESVGDKLDGQHLFVYVNADSVRLPLSCRHWRQGDRIQPLGMKGEKLVSDLFSNAHYTPLQKATTWIVTDASGRLIWVKDLRVAEWCKVSSEACSRLLKIEVIE